MTNNNQQQNDNLDQVTILKPGIWYGSKKSEISVCNIKNDLKKATCEKDLILLIVELLKAGDFSVKQYLLQLMNSTKDQTVLNLCIRVFCSIATHDDLIKSENLSFLSDATDFVANTFAASAPETLSYEVVPYLLAMLEDWEDTYVEQTLRNSLDAILDYSDTISEDAHFEEIGHFYLKQVEPLDTRLYYYEQQPVHPGNLTKELVEHAFISLNRNTALNMFIIPSLLSIWSGEECPITYNTILDTEMMKKLQEYIHTLSKLHWVTGKKYFYSTEI